MCCGAACGIMRSDAWLVCSCARCALCTCCVSGVCVACMLCAIACVLYACVCVLYACARIVCGLCKSSHELCVLTKLNVVSVEGSR